MSTSCSTLGVRTPHVYERRTRHTKEYRKTKKRLHSIPANCNNMKHRMLHHWHVVSSTPPILAPNPKSPVSALCPTVLPRFGCTTAPPTGPFTPCDLNCLDGTAERTHEMFIRHEHDVVVDVYGIMQLDVPVSSFVPEGNERTHQKHKKSSGLGEARACGANWSTPGEVFSCLVRTADSTAERSGQFQCNELV